MISDAVRVFGVEVLEHLENKRKEHINLVIVTQSLVRFTPWISTIDVAVYVEFCSVMMFTNFHFWYFNGDHNSLTIQLTWWLYPTRKVWGKYQSRSLLFLEKL